VHIVAKASAILVAAPLLWAISRKQTLSDVDRVTLATLAVATIVEDGWLLSQWARQPSAVTPDG
jgi:hypothetical protein